MSPLKNGFQKPILYYVVDKSRVSCWSIRTSRPGACEISEGDAMSLIVSEVYDALIEAGATVEKARAAAAAIPVADRMVTKEDMTDQTGKLREYITQVKTDLKQDIARLETDLRKDIARLETDLKQDIARLDKRVAVLNLAVFSFGPTIIVLLLKLVFFPYAP